MLVCAAKLSYVLTSPPAENVLEKPTQPINKNENNDEDAREERLLSNLRKGSNQTAVRGYNERLLLDLIRSNGAVTKAEATRATGLSPNAISVLFRSLEAENLLLRGEPIRGRIGQPSVPMSINPQARYYLGLKIGRRSSDMIVANFAGEILSSRSCYHPYPTPRESVDFAREALRPILRSAKIRKDEISGFGLAMPYELWSWTAEFGAPQQVMNAWRDFDMLRALSGLGDWNIHVENDGTAACGAELVFGRHAGKRDFIYFFIGAFIGGGIVLNGSVFRGRTGNAGGFGPMRVPSERSAGDRLVDHASLVVLEDLITQAGGNPTLLYSDEGAWQTYSLEVDRWLKTTAKSLAHATVSSLSVIDFDSVVIDGSFPADVRERLVRTVIDEIGRLDLQGIRTPQIEAGHFGPLARALGAATLPLASDYMINQNTLLFG